MKTTTISIIGLVVSAFVALNALFIVEQTQQGIVLQFGEPKRTFARTWSELENSIYPECDFL